MQKFTCPSRIIDSMAKDRRFFVLTYFCFSALSELSRSLVIPAVAFTTEAYQFWDLLSALFTHPGMVLLQKDLEGFGVPGQLDLVFPKLPQRQTRP